MGRGAAKVKVAPSLGAACGVRQHHSTRQGDPHRATRAQRDSCLPRRLRDEECARARRHANGGVDLPQAAGLLARRCPELEAVPTIARTDSCSASKAAVKQRRLHQPLFRPRPRGGAPSRTAPAGPRKPAGLSLNSARFLSNQWGPPQCQRAVLSLSGIAESAHLVIPGDANRTRPPSRLSSNRRFRLLLSSTQARCARSSAGARLFMLAT